MRFGARLLLLLFFFGAEVFVDTTNSLLHDGDLAKLRLKLVVFSSISIVVI